MTNEVETTPPSREKETGKATLIVHTARISTRDPDAFNVTRKSGAVAFAPSWGILRIALEEMKRDPDGAWAAYVPAFVVEMRRSYREHRPEWDALLARERVVLTCYCVDPMRCHRTILARDILPRLGATYAGELT